MPQLAYCTDQDEYYTHSEPCTIDPLESAAKGHDVYVLPANGHLDAPIFEEGKIPRRVNGAWVNVENHVGEKGYLNGVPATIEQYGPLPDGWSETPPLPTLKEAQADKRIAINTGFDAALAASLTMPSRSNPPSAVELALAIEDFKTEDPTGWADLRAIHEARRLSLIEAVNVSTSVEEVQAIAVIYAV